MLPSPCLRRSALQTVRTLRQQQLPGASCVRVFSAVPSRSGPSCHHSATTATAPAVSVAAAKPSCHSSGSGISTAQKPSCHASNKTSSCHSSHAAPATPAMTTLAFWQSRSAWQRASVNTFRCLVGCSSGDFAAMWFLQAYYPDTGMWPMMAVSVASGLTSSITLETVLLHYGRDALSWATSVRTAIGMSFISMVTMELAENLVDCYLTGGVVALDDPKFWAAAAVSMLAGFLAPLPYNYIRLRRFGKACH